MSTELLEVVSFGSEYQQDLTEQWIKPAADKCGLDLVPHDAEFLGIRTTEFANWGYPNLCKKIETGANTWDLIHVEDHCVYMPEAKEVFASFPNRIIRGLPNYLQDSRAVPVCQGCYALGWHRDKVERGLVPTWKDFFDTTKISGMRGIRDFPTSNFEIALLSLGRDVNKVLYDDDLSREEIAIQVKDALRQFEKLKEHTVWWDQGYQCHRQILDGDVVMSAMWNRRIMSANQEACAGAAVDDCVIQSNPKTAVLICDWWVIPVGTRHEEAANRLLECMYNDEEALKGAARFSVLQQNLVPVEKIVIEDSFARYFLEMGTWKNRNAALHMGTRFWGKHFKWISDMWKEWRIKFGGKRTDSFTTSPPPPRRKTEA